MSQKYEWLYNTTYPDKVQEFTEKLNITPNDATLIKQIQALIEQKKFAEANELRKQIPNYKQKEIIAQDWNTMADTTVALQLEYDSRYTPSYVLSKEKPTNQSEGDYWYRITNIKYFGETEEIGTGEKSPDNPYELKGQKVPNTDLELFSLPNGTYDEYNENTKVYTKRVEKIVLNGSEKWVYDQGFNNTLTLSKVVITPSNAKKDIKGNIVSDKFITDGTKISKEPYYIYNHYSDSIYFSLNLLDIGVTQSELDNKDLTKIKQWLSKNPVTVLYELETPEITYHYTILGKTTEIGTGEKSPNNPYVLSGIETNGVTLYSLPNGVCDEYSSQTGVLTKRISKVVLNGSEYWKETADSKGDKYFNFTIGNNTKTPALANMYLYIFSWDKPDIKQSCFLGGGDADRLIIKDPSKTLETFKQMLAEKNLIVIYELETPEIIQL